MNVSISISVVVKCCNEVYFTKVPSSQHARKPLL